MHACMHVLTYVALALCCAIARVLQLRLYLLFPFEASTSALPTMHTPRAWGAAGLLVRGFENGVEVFNAGRAAIRTSGS